MQNSDVKFSILGRGHVKIKMAVQRLLKMELLNYLS